MKAMDFIKSIDAKVINGILKSYSDEEAIKHLKEHLQKQLNTHDVSSSSEELTNERKIEKYNEIAIIMKRTYKENLSSEDMHAMIVKVTAYE